MSNFSGVRAGAWSIYSESDPRWRKSGHSEGMLAGCCPEANEMLAMLKELYGEPPADCTISSCKY